jgi:hypothetical protein
MDSPNSSSGINSFQKSLTVRKFESDLELKKRTKSKKNRKVENIITKEMILELIELVN